MWKRRLYVRVTGSIVRTVRRLTGQQSLPPAPRPGEGAGSDWGNVTAEDLRARGILPGMPPPGGAPAARAVNVPRRGQAHRSR